LHEFFIGGLVFIQHSRYTNTLRKLVKNYELIS